MLAYWATVTAFGTLLGRRLSEPSQRQSTSGPSAPEGNYTAKLIKDGETFTTPIRLIVSDQTSLAETLRRLLSFLDRVPADELKNQIYWLQAFK